MDAKGAARLAKLVDDGKGLTKKRSLLEARAVLGEAVALAEQIHGPESLEVAEVLGLLRRAMALPRAGEHDPEVFALGQRMYLIYERVYGTDDRRMHHPMADYALSLELAGQREEALRLYARAAELAQPHEKGDILLLYCHARALAEAQQTEATLKVIDRMLEVEAMEVPGWEPCETFSRLAILALEQFSTPDGQQARLILKYVDQALASDWKDQRAELLAARERLSK